MKLTKDIKVENYEILANYKVKTDKSPFIAVLKYIQEKDSLIYADELHNLLKPLPERACKNILERLTNMGYLDKRKDDDDDDSFYFELTELGEKSADEKIFYEERYGVLKISLVHNEFIPQKIVKIEEKFDRQNKFEEGNIRKHKDSNLKNINFDNIIELDTEDYIINKIESQIKILKDETTSLTLSISMDDTDVSVLDYTSTYDFGQSQIIDWILSNQYNNNYLTDHKIVKTRFTPNNLSLTRKTTIKVPKISKTIFNPITLNNIKFSPINKQEAKEWHKKLTISNIKSYIYSDEDFITLANNIAKKFDLYSNSLENSISRTELIKQLHKKEQFYSKMKLETIDYLNY